MKIVVEETPSKAETTLAMHMCKGLILSFILKKKAETTKFPPKLPNL